MLEFTKKSSNDKILLNFDHIAGAMPSLQSTVIFTSMDGVDREFLVVEDYETVAGMLKRYAEIRYFGIR